MTWLYGPLQQSQISSTSDTPSQPSQGLQRTNSFNKKPILKKRSVSEMMLQKSLSNLNLIQRAVDAVKAQGPVRPALGRRAISDYRGSDPPSVPPESPSPLVTSSFSSPGVQTPNGERRHIHFNEKVDQCIAVEEDDHDDYFSAIKNDDSDDDSDDGIIMMKTDTEKERKLNSRKGTPRTSFSAETNKTIAILPSTTLKYRGDTPEPAPAGSPVWSADKRLTVSSSQETLKPTDPSSNFLLDYDEEMDTSWQPSSASSSSSTSSRKKSIYPRGGIPISAEDEDEEMETRGLRRTPSGMFMPYEEDEDDMVSAGLFGKVVDTVNTARDIAHVIWNVGWRK